MRTLIRTQEFDDFYKSLPDNAKKKLDYVLSIASEIKVVNEQFVKQIVGTEFYELRVQVGNEYRVVVFTIDHLNFAEATQVLLLNGFMKKSKKDYKPATDQARRILNRYNDENKD
jgi:putative component of toxin-antitoxin plasmid stabilization module